MTLKKKIEVFIYIALLASCSAAKQNNDNSSRGFSMEGTWRLISGTLIQGHDTTVTNYTRDQSFIKIINGSHFAFLLHDLHKGKDSGAVFSSGGGTYTLKGNLYTENLEYCSDRQWEGNSFPFHVIIENDTLMQQGVEKVEKLGVERMNIEKYVKVGN
jgi:hypothetical protein